MATNTVKALSEDRKAKVTELRDVSSQLDAKPTDSELLKRFESVDTELRNLDSKIERARRVESLAGVIDTNNDLTGTEDRSLTDGQKKDDPLYDPDGKGYRVLDVIAAKLEGRELKGIAGEVQSAMEERAHAQNRKTRGMLIPMNLPCDLHSAKRAAGVIGTRAEQRDLTLSTGAGALFPQVSPSLITLLRKKTVVQALGAIIMADMTGAFSIPIETAEPVFEWVAEGSAATKSAGAIGQAAFTAKTLTAWTSMTRRFIKQTSQDAEMFARYQLIAGAAVGLDYGALAGPGTTNNVTGVTVDTDVNLIVMGTNGEALSWGKAVEFETAISVANADATNMAWVINGKTRGQAKTTPKVSGYPVFLMENNEINAYPVAVTNQLSSTLTKGSASGTCSAAAFGDWTKLMIALWGGLDILVDPYSEGTTGNIRVISHQDADVNRIHDEAFSRCVDILTG